MSKLVNKEIASLLTESQTSDLLECEFRFGKYIVDKVTGKTTFDATVFADVFFRVKTHLEKFNLERVVEHTLEKIYKPDPTASNKRSGIKCRTNTATNETVTIDKTVLKIIDIHSFGIRVALSKETECKEPTKDKEPILVRNKTRFSFTDASKALRYDLTKVTDAATQVSKYYIELELLKVQNPIERDSLAALVNQRLALVLQMIQDSFHIVTKERLDQVKEWYSQMTRGGYFIGAQPEGLTMGNLKTLNKSSYSVTVKADGQRFFLFVYNGQVILLDSNIQNIKETFVKLNEQDFKAIGNCIVDIELVPASGRFICYLFDILFFNGKDLRGNKQYSLRERLAQVDQVTKILEQYNKEYVFKAKAYYFNNLSLGCKIIRDTPHEFKTDGVIFTPINEPYPTKRKWPGLLKWKDQHDSTIDFYSVQDQLNPRVWKLYVQGPPTDSSTNTINNTNQNKKHQENVKILFDTSKLMAPDKEKYTRERSFETEFDPNERDHTTGEKFLSNTVIEYRFDKIKECFVPMRTRWDKTRNPSKHGNHYTVACDIWRYIQNPISYSQLLKLYTPKGQYNPADKDPHFKTMRQFHNDIKRDLYNQYIRNSDTLLELCSGRGGDLQKWMYNRVKQVDCYDISKDALEIAKSRYTNLQKQNPNSTKCNFYECDIAKDYYKITKKYSNIACNFGLHYLYKDTYQFEKLLNHIKSLLLPNGRLILTIVDDTVLTNSPEEYYTFNREIISYYKYDQKQRQLSVFTSGNNYLSFNTSEYVINKENLIRQVPLQLERHQSFIDIIKNQSKIQLKQHEYSISKLYSILVFRNTPQSLPSPKPSLEECPVYTPKDTSINPLIETIQDIQLIKIQDLYELYDMINMYEVVYNKYKQLNSDRLDYNTIVKELNKHNVVYLDQLTLHDHTLEYKTQTSCLDNEKPTVVIGKSDREILKGESTINLSIHYLIVFENKILYSESDVDKLLETLCEEHKRSEKDIDSSSSMSGRDYDSQMSSSSTEDDHIIEEPSKETTTIVVYDYTKMTINELKVLLRENDLPVSGTKAKLIERLEKKLIDK